MALPKAISFSPLKLTNYKSSRASFFDVAEGFKKAPPKLRIVPPRGASTEHEDVRLFHEESQQFGNAERLVLR